MPKFESILSTILVLSLTASISWAQFADIEPLPGAPYSSSATVPPTLSKVFTGTYTGSGTGREAQARDALAQMKDDFDKTGIGMDAVINVRGYLKVLSTDLEENATAMAEWNAAFNDAFGDNTLPPTRTTFGVYELADPEAVIAIEAVAAVPAQSGVEGVPFNANPKALTLETEHQPVSMTAPFSSMVLTSGILADPVSDEPRAFGDMAQQTTSALKKLEAALRHWGLTPQDVVYVRSLLSPEVIEDVTEPVPVDFAGYQEAFDAYWASNFRDSPPTAEFAAPGFNSTGRIVEIEFYAVFPDSASHTFAGDDSLSYLHRREGSETSFLNRSAAIARDASMVWFAGVIDQTRDHIHSQAVNALLTLEERMMNAGVSFENIVQLRAYLQIENGFRTDFNDWNTAYKRFFNAPSVNPEKPIRTAFPVISIPGTAVIELEAIGVK